MAVGLWAGLIIGFVTEYYTSNAYRYMFNRSIRLSRSLIVSLEFPVLTLCLLYLQPCARCC